MIHTEALQRARECAAVADVLLAGASPPQRHIDLGRGLVALGQLHLAIGVYFTPDPPAQRMTQKES